MANEFSKIPLGRIVVTAVVIVLLSVLIVTLVATGYTIYLGFQARGAPDQGRIDQFARWISSILSPLLGIVLTFLGARWVRKKAPVAKSSSGLILGIAVVLLSILNDIAFGSVFHPSDLLWFALILLAGWLGGRPRGAKPGMPTAQ